MTVKLALIVSTDKTNPTVIEVHSDLPGDTTPETLRSRLQPALLTLREHVVDSLASELGAR